jgi:hypothetical protein
MSKQSSGLHDENKMYVCHYDMHAFIRGEPMFNLKKADCRYRLAIVKSRYLPTIGRLIGKTDGCLFNITTRKYMHAATPRLS